MLLFVDRQIDEIFDGLNKIYFHLSTMNARIGKTTKIELWSENVQSVKTPLKEWLSYW